MNWYKRTKTADASSAIPGGMDGGFHQYEGGEKMRALMEEVDKQRGRPSGYWQGDKNDIIVPMKRQKGVGMKPLKGKGAPFDHDTNTDQTSSNDVVHVPYSIGDTIRQREKGLGMEQAYGKVTDIRDSKLFIKWEGEKNSKPYPLNETVYLAEKFEKV